MKLFGTDGVRGVANEHPMTCDIATELGRAAAYLLCERKKSGISTHPKIVVGKDTRLSGYMLENAISAGFCSMGAMVFLVGPLPTPGIAFITRSMKAELGVVISASHNSYQYNGIKIFDRNGFKLPDLMEEKIENLMFSEELKKICPTMENIGKAKRIDDAIGRYIVFVKNTFPEELNLNGIRVVLDCANGAAYKVAPVVFEELGAEVFSVFCEPNGLNINEQCGAVYPQSMCHSVHEHRAEIGIALDGDGDRVVLADENGELVDGDQILAICAIDMLNRKKLNKNTVVITPMSNMGLEVALKSYGGKVHTVPVGDRYIAEAMRQNGFNLGGEQSGHIIFFDYNSTGDGMVSALQVLSIMVRTRKPLSELKKQMTIYPQILENVVVKKKEDFNKFPVIVETIKKVEEKLGSKGRVFVRYSGTEPLARVMVEGEDIKSIHEYALEICHSIRRELS